MLNVSPQLTSFIGRQFELSEITERIQSPVCRLLTIVGPGGSGKTRVALEAAQYVYQNQLFSDGIYYVPLQPVQAERDVVSAVAEAVHLRFYGNSSPEVQLLEYLQGRNILLLLDNFEHLSGAAELVSTILASAPGVKVLVTSREGLNLQEEWLYPLMGLRFPEEVAETGDIRGIEDFDAIELFVQRAKRVRRDFSLAHEQVHVVRICRLVDGMPLALELAAAWLKALAIQDIVDEIEHGLDILTTQHRNVPARHRSMRVVLEQSWQLLEGDEQEALQRLSIFRGGFRRDAAMRVANTSLPTLAALLDKSFLRWENERYHLHELTRQFATEKLEINGEVGQIRDAHSAYYLSLVAEQGSTLRGPTPTAAARLLRMELDNLRQAWRTAVAQHATARVQSTFETLAYFYEYAGLLVEGQQAFLAAADALNSALSDERESRTLVCHLLIKSVYFWHHLDRSGEIGEQNKRIYKLIRQSGDQLCNAEYLMTLALSEILAGHPEQAILRLREALPLYEEHGEWYHLVFCLQISGETLGRLKRGDEAQSLLQRALQITIEQDDVRGRAITLSHMGVNAFYGEEYAQAHAYFTNAIALFEEIDDVWRAGRTVNNDGFVLFHLEQYDQARQTAQRALALQEKSTISGEIGIVHDTLGQVSYAMGQYDKARAHHQQALAESRQHRRPQYEAEALTYLARIDVAESNLPEAQAQLDQVFSWLNTEPTPQLLAKALEVQGMLHASLGEGELALQRYDEALAQYQAAEQKYEQSHLLLLKGRILLTLGRAEDAQKALHEGLALAQKFGRQSIIQSATNLMAGKPEPTSAAAFPAPKQKTQPLIEPLTERELEVLALIGQGLTNKEIAEQLILSTGTVKWYSGQIYGKLGVNNRTQAVGEAQQLGLLE